MRRTENTGALLIALAIGLPAALAAIQWLCTPLSEEYEPAPQHQTLPEE